MADRSPWRVSVQQHWPTDSVRAVVRGPGYVRLWGEQHQVLAVDEQSGTEPTLPEGAVPYLQLTTDEARALYEALADHFGHSGVDTRALRSDYDAERRRVDTLLASVTRMAEEAVHRA